MDGSRLRMTENNIPQNLQQSAKSSKVSFCGNCGHPVNPAFGFCQNCGAPLPKIEKPKKKSKKGIKIIGILSACVALILGVAIVLSMLFMGGSSSKNNYAVYVKDNELFYTELANAEHIQATADMLDFDEDDNSERFHNAKIATNKTRMTDDGKNCFI